MTTQQNTSRPSHTVYVVEGEGKEAVWTKVGAAWSHNDDAGFNIQLIAMPVSGRLVIRKVKPQTKREER